VAHEGFLGWLQPRNAQAVRGEMMVSARFTRGLIICLLVTAVQSYAWAAPDRAIQPLLAEEWQASAAVLLADEAEQSDPVTRLLIGYVALASNHTNDAMAMFISVQDLDGLHRWREWTEELAHANRGNRVAALLSIDAKARLGEVTTGTQAMQDLLGREPRFALAYDVAGALAILRNDTMAAREAFKTATILDPQLADAWISRGSLEAIARTPLDVPQLGNVPSTDVLGYFDHALALDPTSAPARLGRGVILYGLGRFPEAGESFADAEREAPWLGLAAYNGMQSDLTVLRRYVSQLAAREKSRPGTTMQMRLDQESKLLDGRARESNARLVDTLAPAGTPTSPLDPKQLDTATEPQLRALVATYGLLTIELANAARLDANSADLFQRNTQLQKGVETLSIIRNAWEATATLDVAMELGTWEKGLVLGAIRIAGAYAGSRLSDDQWAGQIGIGRATSVAAAAVKGEDEFRALKSPPALGEVATILNKIFQGQSNDIATKFGDAIGVAQAARNNIRNAQWLSSLGGVPISRPGAGSLNSVLAPRDYTRDAGGQAALINAVAQSVRGGSVVLVPQDRMQSFLLQQELNRQGVATYAAPTPQAAATLAKQSGASWVIGADGHWADPPYVQSSRLPLKPPDILPSCPGCGGPRPQPFGVGGGPSPPPPSAASSTVPGNWSGFQRFTPPASQSTPGGVRTFTDAMIDDGRWPVHVPLTLCLPVVLTAGVGGSPKAR
jgi:tetratricopeptide (TPR) repeat protein